MNMYQSQHVTSFQCSVSITPHIYQSYSPILKFYTCAVSHKSLTNDNIPSMVIHMVIWHEPWSNTMDKRCMSNIRGLGTMKQQDCFVNFSWNVEFDGLINFAQQEC